MRAIAFVRSLADRARRRRRGADCAGCRRAGGGSVALRRCTVCPGRATGRSGGLRALFAEPLTDRTLADVAIRIALLVAWAAVLVFVVTVAAETAHMVRHGGHHLPDVRGLRWSQRGRGRSPPDCWRCSRCSTHAAAFAGAGRRRIVSCSSRPAAGSSAAPRRARSIGRGGADRRAVDTAIIAGQPATTSSAPATRCSGSPDQLAGPDERRSRRRMPSGSSISTSAARWAAANGSPIPD